jgi:ABC-type nitrate/sulfonate/bicarbonate transport system substrate-binding protein
MEAIVLRRLILLCLAACSQLLAPSPPAMAQEKTKVTINAFKSATLWPMWAAQKIGAFDREGLAVDLSYTRDSKSQLTGAIEGKFDIITTALDNVIAYSEGEGAPGTPKGGDLIAFLGGHNGLLSLVAQPEIRSVKDLKGTDLAVDAISTGYSFVLQEILAKNGLGPNDYKLISFGNTGARWQALQKKQAAAGLLTPPFTQVARGRGFSLIADASEVLGGYQGSVSATRRDWARQHPDIVVRYIRAYRAGQEWLLTPANKDAAIAILMAEFPQATPQMGQANYTNLVASGKGYNPGAKLDLAGAKNVLDLRRRYGPKGKTITDARHFVDESYFNRAVKP